MKPRQHSIYCLMSLFALALTMTLCLAPAAHMQKDSANASMQTKGGLNIVTFDTINGQVIVNLPNDMMAGDTISGTVVAEPKKESEGRSMQIELLFDMFPEQGLKTVNVPTSAGSRETFTIKIPPGAGNDKTGGQIKIALKGKDSSANVAAPAQVIATATMHVWSHYGEPQMGTAGDQAGRVQLPTRGQQGRASEIQGPFDGNSSNTNVKIGGQDVPILAESPRGAVFRAPTNVTGQAEITVKEGNKETKGTFRNVGVNLTAPKTSLLKGESTELHVEVQGLQGITEPVPLHLTKGGVVTMQGGDLQTMSIKPSEVQNNGTFTTTRTITGVEKGVWNATATVVVFDYCLQDDNNRNTLMFSSETGDYRFCGFAPGVNIAIAALDTIGGGNLSDPHLLTGHYDDLSMNRSVITFEHNGGDRRVLINLSKGFLGSATATVQTTNPKRTFTITGRDTRNNTCTCQ